MVPSQEVTLVAATADDATVLSSLLELYLRELSEIFPIEVRADGQLGYDKLPLYWTEPSTHFAFLIRCRAQIAGFVLVTRGSPATDDPEDLDVAEFSSFSYRRTGIGRRAAFLLWNRLSGRWIVRVSEANLIGLPFWERIIGEYTQDAFDRNEHPGQVSHVPRLLIQKLPYDCGAGAGALEAKQRSRWLVRAPA
ncbi:MAG TPA: hypothetical protein VHR41_13620 [Gemmatimonadales bacterium]|nr:hypothetical protein [Gemmatimonadales bacterium]